MTSHNMTSVLLNSTNEVDNSTLPDLATTNATLLPDLNTTTVRLSTLKLSPLSTQASTDNDSHMVFVMCTIMFFVAIALIMKIVYSNRKKYRNLTPSIPSWRLSASRSSANVPAGFALSRDSFVPRTARGEAFGSAHYVAVPPSTTARLSNQQQQDAFVGDSRAQLEWERQFFDDDTSNDNNSRLEFRR